MIIGYNTTPKGYAGMTVTYSSAGSRGAQRDACIDEADGRRIAEGAEEWVIEDAEGNVIASSDE